MIIYLTIAGTVIIRAGFECNPGITPTATGSILASWLQNKSVSEAQAMTQEALAAMVGYLPLGMRYVPGVAAAALDAALADLRQPRQT